VAPRTPRRYLGRRPQPPVNERAASFAAVPALTPCRCTSLTMAFCSSAASLEQVLRRPLTDETLKIPIGPRVTTSDIFSSSFAHCPPPLDDNAIEIHGDSTILKLLLRFPKNFLVGVAAGNVSQHQPLDLARCRTSARANS
jgi:hypothetical protein